MSPLVALHASHPKCRESIYARGLLTNQPAKGRPCGVYVFRPDDAIDHPSFSRGGRIRWDAWGGPWGSEVWLVAYIGPLTEDHYVENALVLLDSVEPTHVHNVTLVTRNI